MATIVTRAGKGSALTHTEMDANFTNLNTELAGAGASLETFTSSGTWTKPSTGTVALVTCIGGGGGGGQSYYYTADGAYGGGIQSKWIPLSQLGSTVTVTIGAGGAGSTGFSDAGGNGGITSFGNHVYVLGGKGGNAQNGYYSNTQTDSGNTGVTSFPSDYQDSSEFTSAAMVFRINQFNNDYQFYSSSITPWMDPTSTAGYTWTRTVGDVVPWCVVGTPAYWNSTNGVRIARTNSSGYGFPGAGERANSQTGGGANTAQSGGNGFCSVVVF